MGKNEKVAKKIRTQEEIKLREFVLLDEVGPFDDKDDGAERKKSYCDDDYYEEELEDDDDDLSEDEIDAMLEESNTFKISNSEFNLSLVLFVLV